MPTLITEGYRAQQSKLHADRPDYGSASIHYAPLVTSVVDKYRVKDMVDYGSGKGRLGQTMRENFPPKGYLAIHQYDPAFPDIGEPPEPQEMVACIDVLEHVEPDCLDAVLDDLKRCTKKWLLATVHTGAAQKTLEDGRNAHLIQEDESWWMPKFWARGFRLEGAGSTPGGFWVLWQSRIMES